MTPHLATGLERLAARAAEAADDLPVERMRVRARRRRAVRTAAASAAGVGAAGVLATAALNLPSAVQQAPGHTSGASSPSVHDDVPSVRLPGSRPVEYTSIDRLAEDASAIVVVRPTGRHVERALPDGGTESAPSVYVEMSVEQVVSGSVESSVIDVVSPGDDQTGTPVLTLDRPFVLFLTPAMYGADEPAGGYAVVGGPAGVYAGAGDSFVKVDVMSPRLPRELLLDSTEWPAITRTEGELVERWDD